MIAADVKVIEEAEVQPVDDAQVAPRIGLEQYYSEASSRSCRRGLSYDPGGVRFVWRHFPATRSKKTVSRCLCDAAGPRV
jgi:hypothetical protein